MIAHRPDILLQSGNFFNFLTPKQSTVTVEDIAQGLANESRFNGQTKSFYSVAQHSVLVSLIVPDEHAFAGLFHDCTEAVMKDIPKPLKRLLPDYQALEHSVEAALFAKLGIALPLHPSIKEADLILLATEKRDLMPVNDHPEWPDIQPLEQIIVPLLPTEAKALFLKRYYHLVGLMAVEAA